jgi:phosphoribosyl-ATP pyrophosphohydrolase
MLKYPNLAAWQLGVHWSVNAAVTETEMPDLLARLAAVVASRRRDDPSVSHTAALLARGPAKCAEKFGEEAVEAIVAAASGDRAGLVAEAADVLYHLQVMLAARDVAWAEVLAELEAREGRSGVAEKAGRGGDGT